MNLLPSQKVPIEIFRSARFSFFRSVWTQMLLLYPSRAPVFTKRSAWQPEVFRSAGSQKTISHEKKNDQPHPSPAISNNTTTTHAEDLR